MEDRSTKRAWRLSVALYVLSVAVAGLAVVALSAAELLEQGQEYQRQWISLVALTVVSGLLPVNLPSISVAATTSETFVIAGTILFGQAGGTVLSLLDGLFITLFLMYVRGQRWQQIVFNLTATPVSVWVSAELVGVQPLFGTSGDLGTEALLRLGAFSTLHFLINSWLLAFALAIHGRRSAIGLWWGHLRELLVNFAAGGSIAALLVYNTREVAPEFVFAIIPLLLVLFLTYRWSNKRVEAERERNADLSRVFMSTIEALALAIDAKDQVTHGHIRRVQRYTLALAKALGITDPKELDAIRAAALLHDTGKLAVPEYILNKPGPLSVSEFEKMKVHADVGADILKSIDFPYPVEPIVRHHHEQWDGTGYPSRIRGQEIPIGARILSVVDCYDALTSDRPYRPECRGRRLNRSSETDAVRRTDPWIVDRFIGILDDLEELDAAEEQSSEGRASVEAASLHPITETTVEEREFSELRRELSRAPTLAVATDILLRHTKRLVPASVLAFYTPKVGSNDISVVAAHGVGAAAISGTSVQIGDRISGWAFAHAQSVLNSEAALELGDCAKDFAEPLRYASAVPIMDRQVLAILMVYPVEPLERDHGRRLENAASLFSSSLSTPMGKNPTVVIRGPREAPHETDAVTSPPITSRQ